MYSQFESASRINGYLFIAFILLMFASSLPLFTRYIETREVNTAIDGSFMRDFESFYDENMLLHKPSLYGWSRLQLTLLNEGRVGVLTGKEGWFFSNEEYFQPSRLAGFVKTHVERIAAVHSTLAEQGTQLVLLPVPLKTDIYSQFTGIEPSEGSAQLEEALITGLGAHAIQVVRTRDAFKTLAGERQLFLKTDTHWSVYGAQLAAQQLADQYPVLVGTENYETSTIESVEYSGDLLKFFSLGPLRPANFPDTEQLAQFETAKVFGGFDSEALFGDVEIDTALVGSSYTELPEWNFTGFIQQALQREVMSFANTRAGPYASMRDFVASPEFTNGTIRLVIWEYPLRSMFFDERPEHSDTPKAIGMF